MIKLNRKSNPHITFGRGPQVCLHARLIDRTLISKLTTRLDGIHILSEKRHVEREPGYERIHGYDFLTVRFEPRAESTL